MTAADLIERLRRYPIPTISAAVVLACFLAYYFRMDLLTDLEDQRNEVLNQRDQVDLNLVAGATLAEHAAEMRARFGELGARIVQPSELADNMNYFYQLESNTGVSLIDLRQNVVAEKPVARNRLAGVGYTISLSGQFPQVIGYLDELENGSRFFRLRDFSLQRGRETTQASVALTLNLELLGWKE
jgi:Tfp pilus assembly protein PilO